MAKNTRGGLGRGLNSLLGGTFESPAPAAPSPARERVTVNADDSVAYASRADRERRYADDSALANEGESRITGTEPASVKEEPVADAVDFRDIIEKKLDEIPLESISPNPDQPRTNFKKEEIEELAASIEKDGLLQPILVRTMADGSYQIVAGERRWQACKSLGLKTVPVRIKDADDDKALELALIENIQRSDLNPIEEAYGYRRLMERRRMTQAEVAQAMSKGRSTVANALRLLELPEEAQQLLFEDKITAGHARAILSIPSKEGRETLTKKLIEEKMSVREAESLARLLAGKQSKPTASRQPLPPVYKSAAKTLRDVLGTNVRVKSSKGKNKIEIEFKDESDLTRLLGEILERKASEQ